jgi:Ni,Fe-hydrogenase III large subunit
VTTTLLQKILHDAAQGPAKNQDAGTKPVLIETPAQDILESTRAILASGSARFLTTFATPISGGGFEVRTLYSHKSPNPILCIQTRLARGERLPSLTGLVPGANWLEREMIELLGVPLDGHPDPRPVLQHRGWPLDAHPLQPAWHATKDTERLEKDPDYGFLQVEGDGVCEVPVGPIHAGIIEPGHFRFSIAGEPVLNLEIRLGYQHKGIEKLHEGRTPDKGLFLAERTSGDNSVAHSTAYCMAIESLSPTQPSPHAEDVRSIYLELERITHHLGDIGGVLLDVAYNFGASQLAILREDMFRLNARLSGSRLLFGVNAIGGIQHDITNDKKNDIRQTLDKIEHDFARAIKISLSSASVLDRFDATGTLTTENARLLSVVGPAARASGIDTDARKDHPHAAYGRHKLTIQGETRGDVMSRVRVKKREIQESIRFIRDVLDHPTNGAPIERPTSYRANELGVGITEAHRGEVLYAIILDDAGRIRRCHARDPSTLNWRALELAVPNGNIIADFPVINKSFNLSYSGNDR